MYGVNLLQLMDGVIYVHEIAMDKPSLVDIIAMERVSRHQKHTISIWCIQQWIFSGLLISLTHGMEKAIS